MSVGCPRVAGSGSDRGRRGAAGSGSDRGRRTQPQHPPWLANSELFVLNSFLMAIELSAVAVRLAVEGVPLAAIARTLQTSSGTIREYLRGAQSAGDIVEMPREDWPPGFPRDERASALARMVLEKRNALSFAVWQVFALPPAQSAILLVLLQHEFMSRDHFPSMSPNTLHVHIAHMRKWLKPYGVAIHTIWGQGYYMTADDRARATAMIVKASADAEAAT